MFNLWVGVVEGCYVKALRRRICLGAREEMEGHLTHSGVALERASLSTIPRHSGHTVSYSASINTEKAV